MHEPQNADGMAHIAYFDVETQLSFVWDGKSVSIDVCHGGYGEPVIDRYRPTTMNPRIETRARNWLDWFETACKSYVVAWKEKHA